MKHKGTFYRESYMSFQQENVVLSGHVLNIVVKLRNYHNGKRDKYMLNQTLFQPSNDADKNISENELRETSEADDQADVQSENYTINDENT